MLGKQAPVPCMVVMYISLLFTLTDPCAHQGPKPLDTPKLQAPLQWSIQPSRVCHQASAERLST